MNETKPKRRFPEGFEVDSTTLVAGRYGTLEMVNIFGPEQTFQESLHVQGQAAMILSELHPDIVPEEDAKELERKASLKYISTDRIRESSSDSSPISKLNFGSSETMLLEGRM